MQTSPTSSTVTSHTVHESSSCSVYEKGHITCRFTGNIPKPHLALSQGYFSSWHLAKQDKLTNFSFLFLIHFYFLFHGQRVMGLNFEASEAAKLTSIFLHSLTATHGYECERKSYEQTPRSQTHGLHQFFIHSMDRQTADCIVLD